MPTEKNALAEITNERYRSTLQAVDTAAFDLNEGLRTAHDALTGAGQHRALVNLHNRTREVAALLNDALGRWPAAPDNVEEKP